MANDNSPDKILRMDPEAWESGFSAGESRARRCPYPAGSREAWSWSSGYIEGDAKRQGFSYSRGALKPKGNEP